MTIFQDKLLTRTDCDETGDYVVSKVLSPRDLVFRPDIGHKLYHHQTQPYVNTINLLSFTIPGRLHMNFYLNCSRGLAEEGRHHENKSV